MIVKRSKEKKERREKKSTRGRNIILKGEGKAYDFGGKYIPLRKGRHYPGLEPEDGSKETNKYSKFEKSLGRLITFTN